VSIEWKPILKALLLIAALPGLGWFLAANDALADRERREREGYDYGEDD
jgi:hypothetical protein